MGSIRMRGNERGLISIVITVVIMLVISTVVIAFAQLVRREQRQALDRQLNTQAFYAAESGINDARKVIETAGLTQDFTSDCNEFAETYNLEQTVGDVADGVRYTCLLVDPSPPNIDFSSVSSEESKIFALRTKNASDSITQTMVSWENKAGDTDYSGCPAAGNFPQNWPNNCSVGIMRVDIVPFNGPMSRDDLANQTFTAFLHPRTGVSGNVNWDSGVGINGRNQGVVVAANCAVAADRDCKVQIQGMPGGQQYYMRIRSLYRQSAVTICSPNCANPVELTGAQALIDATGRATDILKRIQVRVPIGTGGSVPEAALQTNDTQCKRFSFTPTSVFTDNSDPACNPTN